MTVLEKNCHEEIFIHLLVFRDGLDSNLSALEITGGQGSMTLHFRDLTPKITYRRST